MATSKWIVGLERDMPMAKAARVVLDTHLGAVAKRLPQALHEADEDSEHVHQLRVSTRRGGAALRIFADCLSEKTYKAARKYLRQIRRSAGAARDWDVFLQTLTARLGRAAVAQRSGLDFLLGFAHGLRLNAQKQLIEAGGDQTERGPTLLGQIKEELDSADGATTLVDVAVPTLHDLVAEVDAAAERDLEAYENLHQVRIQGKRLRYAMEVFACCFDSAFRTRIYPAVEEMQEILGHANDSYVASQRLESLRSHLQITQPREWKRWQAGIVALLQYHQRRLPLFRRQFQQWWHKWRSSKTALHFHDLVQT